MTEVKSLYDIGFEHGYAKAKEEAEPVKHGRWVWKDHYLVCSECGEENDRKNYCPNCGAKMDGEEDGNTD